VQEGATRGDPRPGDRHHHQQARPDRRRKEADDGQEISPEIKALFTRMMRPPGT
jgi:hypothetical protein